MPDTYYDWLVSKHSKETGVVIGLFVCLFVLPLFKEGDVITCYSFLTYGLLRAFYPANHDTPQKKDHNAGNYMSLRKVCGLFYVQQDYEH